MHRMPARAPSSAADDTRSRLLRAGLAIARRSGLRAVTVRGVTTRARANLGSFVHHFGTRDAFLAEMVEGWYAPLLARLQPTLDEHGPVLQRLRRFCLALLEFLTEHRVFVSHVLLDAAAGEKPAQRFVRALPARHPAMLLQLITPAQAGGEIDATESPLHVMLYMLSALALPVVALTAMGRTPLLPAAFGQALQQQAADPARVVRRLDWVLAGLQAQAQVGTAPAAGPPARPARAASRKATG
jgi:TetR/AcrR family transcriptional repressor of nem operon